MAADTSDPGIELVDAHCHIDLLPQPQATIAAANRAESIRSPSPTPPRSSSTRAICVAGANSCSPPQDCTRSLCIRTCTNSIDFGPFSTRRALSARSGLITSPETVLCGVDSVTYSQPFSATVLSVGTRFSRFTLAGQQPTSSALSGKGSRVSSSFTGFPAPERNSNGRSAVGAGSPSILQWPPRAAAKLLLLPCREIASSRKPTAHL